MQSLAEIAKSSSIFNQVMYVYASKWFRVQVRIQHHRRRGGGGGGGVTWACSLSRIDTRRPVQVLVGILVKWNTSLQLVYPGWPEKRIPGISHV